MLKGSASLINFYKNEWKCFEIIIKKKNGAIFQHGGWKKQINTSPLRDFCFTWNTIEMKRVVCCGCSETLAGNTDTSLEETKYCWILKKVALNALSTANRNYFHLDRIKVSAESQRASWNPDTAAANLVQSLGDSLNRCNHRLRVWLLALITETLSLFLFQNTDSLNYLKSPPVKKFVVPAKIFCNSEPWYVK